MASKPSAFSTAAGCLERAAHEQQTVNLLTREITRLKHEQMAFKANAEDQHEVGLAALFQDRIRTYNELLQLLNGWTLEAAKESVARGAPGEESHD